MASQFNDSFNNVASKIVNAAELERRVKEELNAPFHGPAGVIKKSIITVVEMAPGLANIPNVVKQALQGNIPAVALYVSEDKVAVFEDARADMKKAIADPHLGSLMDSNGMRVINKVGKENIYQDSQDVVAAYTAIAKPSKRILAAYQTAIEKSTDYSAQVQSGKLIKMSL